LILLLLVALVMTLWKLFCLLRHKQYCRVYVSQFGSC